MKTKIKIKVSRPKVNLYFFIVLMKALINKNTHFLFCKLSNHFHINYKLFFILYHLFLTNYEGDSLSVSKYKYSPIPSRKEFNAF